MHSGNKEIVMVTDVVADLIIRIKNAGMVHKAQVEVPYSKLRNSIAQKLRAAQYVTNVESVGHGTKRKIVISLAYDKNKKHRVRDVKRISKPGRRVYIGAKKIRPVKNNHGILLLSTPKGILTGEEARREHTGGEALFSIW